MLGLKREMEEVSGKEFEEMEAIIQDILDERWAYNWSSDILLDS